MAFGTARQMYPVDVNCGKCGTHISELPFEPKGDRPVYCSECNRQFRQSRGFGGGGGGGMGRGAPKQMYSVDLSCAGCGAKITQLPFQPSGDRPVYCRECLQARRNQMAA